jgi:hypothetical protein
LLVSLRCKFEIHLFMVKEAVERSLKCEAVLDI